MSEPEQESPPVADESIGGAWRAANSSKYGKGIPRRPAPPRLAARLASSVRGLLLRLSGFLRYLVLWLVVLTFLPLPACRDTASTAGVEEKPLIDLLAAAPRRIELETRRVIFASTRRGALLSGWSRSEWNRERNFGYVWATAHDAKLALRILDVRDLQFVVNLVPFPSVEPQRITLLMNDQEITEIDPAPELREYRFVVAANLLRRGKNVLTFRHAVLSRRPDGRDSRSFAAGYVSLLLGPNCLPLRPRGEILPPRLHDRDRQASSPQPLSVTGPAELSYRFTVPAAARLRYRVTLPPQSREPARFTVRLRDGDTWRDLAVTPLARSILRLHADRDVSVDLSPWSGKNIDLRFGVYPEPCAAPLATVAISQAGVFGDSDSSGPTGSRPAH